MKTPAPLDQLLWQQRPGWQPTPTEQAIGILRFTIRAVLALSALILAIFGLWFVANTCLQLAEWCSRVLFSTPW